jgi:BirA family biotin operon repressor/biotin-[acetyl-CoA-carboxylase] ligase
MAEDLTAGRITAALRRRGVTGFGRPLTVKPLTRSTNEDARLAALEGAAHGAAFVAEEQTAGRGRRGHSWYSPAGENIYLSVVLRPSPLPAAVVPAITLAVGVAVAQVVDGQLCRAATGQAAQIKWPNDVLIGGRKVAGVLMESFALSSPAVVGSTAYAPVLVAGIGLNVATRSFPAELADRATSLALAGCGEPDRAELVAELLAQLATVSAELAAAGGLTPGLRAELTRRDALRHRPVVCGAERGVAEGIAPDGCLLIRNGAGELVEIRSGEVRSLA